MTEHLGFVPSWSAEFPNDNPALHDGISWVCLDLCGPPRPVIRPRAARRTEPQEPVAAPEPVAVAEPDPVADPDPVAATQVDGAPLTLDMADAGVPSDEAATCEPLQLDGIESPLRATSSADPVFEFDADEAAPEATSPARVVEEPAPSPDPFAAYVAALVEVATLAGHSPVAAALPMLLEGAAFDASSLPEGARERLIAARILVRSDAALSPSEGFTSIAGAWRSVLRGVTHDLSACGASTLDGWSAELLSAFGVGQGGATDVRRELRRRGVAAFGMLLAA